MYKSMDMLQQCYNNEINMKFRNTSLLSPALQQVVLAFYPVMLSPAWSQCSLGAPDLLKAYVPVVRAPAPLPSIVFVTAIGRMNLASKQVVRVKALGNLETELRRANVLITAQGIYWRSSPKAIKIYSGSYSFLLFYRKHKNSQ